MVSDPSPVGGSAALTDEVLLAARSVSKWFGGTRALDAVSLEVRAGEVHALAGANGSGKSTLVKVLSGVERPDRGEIVHPGALEGALGVGTVHQELGLFLNGTVRENIFALQRGALLARQREEQVALDLLGQVRAQFALDTPVLDLTIEDKALVAVARALAATRGRRRRVLVVDEVTSVLRGASARRFVEALGRLRDAGVGIVFVSHDLDEVLGFADRITVLRDGRVRAVVEARDVTRAQLIGLMTGGAAVSAPGAATAHASDAPEALSVQNLRGSLVDGVDFSIRSGEIVGLIGVGGSGYDEVPYLLAGTATPRSGVVRVGDVAVATPVAFARAGGRIIPADRNRTAIAAAGTVLENFMLDHRGGRSRLGIVRARHERRVVQRAVCDYGVKCASIDSPITSLSGGNQQKLILARCLESDPRLLVMHEPTQGVDVHARAELLALIHAAVATRALGVLYVSGELEELWENCGRILVVRRGVVVGELDPSRDGRGRAHELLY